MTASEAGGSAKLPFGPVQMIVLEFDSDHLKGEILPELRRLKDDGVIRLIDLMVVQKHDNGEVESIQDTDLTQEESMEFGALIGALVGFGAGGTEEAELAAVAGAAELEGGRVFHDAEIFYLADLIPNGSMAAVALIEHLWAIPLRDKIIEAGGVPLADEWIHPADLVAVGALLGETAGAEA
jgi:uncharacterized membrane protein